MKAAVIIAAAGIGSRFASSEPGDTGSTDGHKLDIPLGDRPVLMRSVDLFVNRADVTQVIVAANPDNLELFKRLWGTQLSFLGVNVIAGGRKDRWETVQIALGHVNDECTHVAIHDGARPLASSKLIDRIFQAAVPHKAVIPGIPVNSTLKRIDDKAIETSATDDQLDDILGPSGGQTKVAGTVTETVNRQSLYQAQTPQIFEIGLLRRAYEGLTSGSIDPAAATDDASVVEAIGESVAVVQGEATNIKITYPDDVELANAIVAAREKAEAATTAKKRLFADDEDEF